MTAERAQRVVAVDYGEARMGLAGTDALGLLAHPIQTIPARPWLVAAEKIAEVVAARGAGTVVMGLPVRMDGTEGTVAAKVRRFAAELAQQLPAGVGIVFQDEYGSTMAAAEQLRVSGRRSRSHRPVIDQAAAVVILEEWMAARDGAVGGI
ncbi:MAG: Holliday junction resolvase RuvX [Verrucomicrobiota bacterium]